MFKKIAASLSVLMFLSTASFADDIFYQGGQVGSWSVFGNSGNTTQNPACVAEVTWDDGSKFQLIKDLKNGEFYIWFQNNEWNIIDPPGNYTFRMNIVNRANQVAGGDMTYQLVNKNTIAVRELDVDSFVGPFMEMTEIRFIMPGDIGNAFIPLNGSTAAIEKLVQCLDAYKAAPSNQNTAPLQQGKVPGQDI
jgi:hypothetical protein